jgi:hypothetical protein
MSAVSAVTDRRYNCDEVAPRRFLCFNFVRREAFGLNVSPPALSIHRLNYIYVV